MRLLPLSLACPQCGSNEVLYSCSPSCCFNHVCSGCYTTFEPVTKRVGEFESELGQLPDLDASGPTAACARCGAINLFRLEDDSRLRGVVCGSCRALLAVELTEI